MTQEHKELLLKDLCARLPYDVKCKIEMWIGYDVCTIYNINSIGYVEIVEASNTNGISIERVKPYLFPLSSMTDEQKKEYTNIVNYISSDDTENWKEGEFIYVEQFTQLMRFYHINHLDYMGLIPMGLAINANGLNIY